MAYTHKEILAKHQKIHDTWLDRLEEMLEKKDSKGNYVVKGTFAILGYVEREWNLIVNIEERMKAAGTVEKDDDTKTIGWAEIDEESDA